MKKAEKILSSFFKVAEDDGDINGSTGVLTDLMQKEYKTPTENSMRGLPNKSASSYPRGKTPICRGKDCPKPATGGGLFCDTHHSMPKGTVETKPPSKVQYVDPFTQKQIWNADPRNKKASQVLKEFFK